MMSRYFGDRNSGEKLEAAEYWRRKCLSEDGSMFSEKSLWRPDHLNSLERYFINQLDEGEGNFYQKLSKQLAPTAPEVKQLAAEILWVMLLCPSNIGADKKREGILEVWGWSGEPLHEDSRWLSDSVLAGVGSAGTAYNIQRWREVVFSILFLIQFKKFGQSEREQLLKDGWAFAKWLEQIPDCNSRQFRFMLLFMLFPDDFERIFGGTDRRKIISTFTGKSDAQVRALTALDEDKEIAAIRKKHEDIYGTAELDFYLPPLRELWRDERNVAWLINWNPKYWSWETLDKDRTNTHTGTTVRKRWSFANQNAKVGDKAYLSRTGVAPKGIVAVGNIVKAPSEGPHWNEEKAAAGATARYVEVDFTRIQDPVAGDPYISNDELGKITFDQQVWSPQSSGIEIKSRSAAALKKLWEKVVESTKQNKQTTTIATKIEEATNLIYYGPPGTGKTYQLGQFIEKYSSKKQLISHDAWLVQKLQDVRWFDVIFATLYDLGGKAKVADIAEHKFIVLKARGLGRQKNIKQTIWATLQAHAPETSQTVRYKNKSAPFVFDKSEGSVWSLVGDWQEECAEQLDLANALKTGPEKETEQHRYAFVTFHQAYSYEDFVEGIRPFQDDDSGEMIYMVVDGVFRRIAQKAKADPNHRYAIFIDEINRGNIAKIFGELITLMEPDKRAVYNEDGEKLSGMELTLPYSGDLFGVPKNLDLYGAMNTADRSIALIDTALRRRFKFKELMPDAGLISGSQGDGYIEDGEGGSIDLRALIESMNQRIRFLLNRDMTIGHAYFMNVKNFTALKDLLLNQIIPLLQEYFYEDWHRIQLVFQDVGPGGEKLEPQIICHNTLNKQEVIGFDHEDYEDLIEYWVAPVDEITPEAVRKIYEKAT